MKIFLLLLLFLVSACAKTIEIEQRNIDPPYHLLEKQLTPAFQGTTNLDLVEYVLDLQNVIALYEINLQSLQEWFKSLQFN